MIFHQTRYINPKYPNSSWQQVVVINQYFQGTKGHKTVFFKYEDMYQVCYNTLADLHFSPCKQKRNSKTPVLLKIEYKMRLWYVQCKGTWANSHTGQRRLPIYGITEIPEKQEKLPSRSSKRYLCCDPKRKAYLHNPVQTKTTTTSARRGPLVLNARQRICGLPKERGVLKKKIILIGLRQFTGEWRDVAGVHTWGLKPFRLRRKLL